MLSRAKFLGALAIYASFNTSISANAQEPGGAISLDEITVTATKREQPLARIDGGVSVVTAQELRDNNVRTIGDLQKVFPGLKIDARGNRAYANVTVRGISSPDYYSPAVQIYVDGAPQAPSAFVQDLLDVERVEFLRGPQGTLYGRNAYAGVINIITRKARGPRLDVFGTAANRLFEAGAAGTVPLVPDSLFLDLAAKGSRFTGEIRDIDGKNNIDGRKTFNGRAQLRYAPTGGPFDMTAWVSHEHLDSHEEIYIIDSDVRKRRYRSSIVGPYNVLKRDITSTGATFNYRFQDLTLSNTASFGWVDLERRIFGSDFPETDRNFSNELKLTYDAGGPFKGIAGIAYLDGRFTREAPGYPGYYSASRNRVDSRSLAAFGEATYALTKQLELTAGARISRDWAKIDFDRAIAAPIAPLLPYGSFNNSANYTGFQPKVSLGYQLDEDTRLYALVSRGYKPGGFNHAISTTADAADYRPETAWNYEIGARTSLFGGKLSLSGALYHIRSTNKQIYVGPMGLQVIRNAGKAESTGIELEATLRPTDRLTVVASAAFGRSEFTDFVDPLTGVSYNDNRVPYAPDVKVDLSARYRIAQSFIPYDVTLTGAAHYVGKTYFNEANTLSQKAFATFDAGIEIALPRETTLKVFAENLTDKAYRTNSFEYLGQTLSTVGQGRLIGVSMRTKF